MLHPCKDLDGIICKLSMLAACRTISDPYMIDAKDAGCPPFELYCLLLYPPLHAVVHNTGTVITCIRNVAAFPAAFSFVISASSRSSACVANTSRTVLVSSRCCVGAASYARHPSRATCLSVLGYPSSGFMNNFTITTTPTAQYPLVYGNCTTSSPTGTVPVSCATTVAGVTTSKVTIGVPSQSITGGTASRYFYVGCSLPSGSNKCQATAGWGAASCSSAASATAVPSCGGTFSAARTITLACPCTAVWWIVASVPNAPATLTAPMVNGACLP